LTPEKPIHKRKHVYRPKTSNIRINKDTRNNNVTILSKIKHPKKQPVSNIRRRMGEDETFLSKLSIDERHKQRRQGAGEFLDETMWKKQKICCGFIFIGPNGEVAVDHRYLQRCDACKILKEPAIPSTVTSAAHTNGTQPIRFTESMVSKSLLREFDQVVSMDMTTHTAEDESAEEECDSLGEDQSASSLCSSQSDDAIRAAKLAFDVESEVTGDSAEIMNSPDFGVDADEGLHTPIGSLSGGMKVKIVLAAAMWQNPHVLILDEPTNYLDRDGLVTLCLTPELPSHLGPDS
jgi:hypothetical protein